MFMHHSHQVGGLGRRLMFMHHSHQVGAWEGDQCSCIIPTRWGPGKETNVHASFLLGWGPGKKTNL